METIAIVGSRGYPKIPVWNYVMYKMPAGTQVISGGCPNSPDQWAEEAVERRIRVFGDIPEIIVYSPDREAGATYGQKCAARNRKIASACDRLIAFWDGCSRGTRMVIAMAREEFIPVEIVRHPDEWEETGPIPLREQCAIDITNCIADHPWGISQDGIAALLREEGHNDNQIAYSIKEMVKKCLITEESNEEHGAVYVVITGVSKPVTGERPSETVLPTGGNLDTEVYPISATFNKSHEEFLTKTQEQLDRERMDPRQRTALEAIDNFQRSLKKIEREARNWSWSEDLMEVTTRHYHPRKKGENGAVGVIEINTYDFRGDDADLSYGPSGRGFGVCSCPRRLYHQKEPCAHMIERDRKLREERMELK